MEYIYMGYTDMESVLHGVVHSDIVHYTQRGTGFFESFLLPYLPRATIFLGFACTIQIAEHYI